MKRSESSSLSPAASDDASDSKVHVGIDVSKNKLDICVLREGKLKHKVISNDKSGFAAFAQWLVSLDLNLGDVHVCLEATGPYSEAIVGAAMHKLAHLIYGVLKTGKPFRADWIQVRESAIEQSMTKESEAVAAA